MGLQKVGLIAVLNMTQFNRAYNQYIRRLGIMNATTTKTSKSLSGQFLGMGNSLLKVAGILSGAVVVGAGLATVALTKMAIDGIKESADLEQNIANIAATMNLTSDQASFLKDVIIDLGLDPRLRVTTFEAAEAMDLLAKNGIFAGLSIQEMESVAREAGTAVVMLANATGAEFGQAADIATDVMAIFNKESSELMDIVSGITSVTTNSKFTIDDYALALRNGAASGALMGVSLEDFNTAMVVTAEETGTGMKAGTGFLNFMNRLTPNTNKATDAMKDLGLITAEGTNLFFDASGELKSMSDISQLLNQSLFGTQKVISEVGGRTAEQNKLLGELNAEYSDAQKTIDNYTTGLDSLLASEEEKNAAISEAQSIMEKLSPTIEGLNGIQGEYVTTTQNLTAEQRSMAAETIFGNDALKAMFGLAGEGALVVGRLDEVVAAYGVSFSEASRMVAEGLTEFELTQQIQSQTDAVANAETRMDTLKGKLEILGGVFEAIRIKFGDQFINLLSDLAERFTDLITLDDGLMNMVETFGKALSDLFTALLDGESPLESFVDFLDDIGQNDLADKLVNTIQSVRDFITPIAEFVDEHSEEFMGALKGIGAVLAGSAIAALLAGVASAIGLILSPLGLLFVAVAILGAIWESEWTDIQGVTKSAVKKISKFLDDIGVLEFVDNLREAFGDGGFKGLIEAIPDALSGLGSQIQTAFLEWFNGVDWQSIGMDIVTSLFDGMTSAGESAADLVNMFVDWVSTVDWEVVGTQVVDGLLTAVGVIFALNAIQFKALFNFFESLITNVDWMALGETLWGFFRDLNVGVYNRLGEILPILLTSFRDNLLNPWLDSINEKDQELQDKFTQFLSNGIFSAIEWLQENIAEPWNEFWESVWTWFSEQTWEDLGFIVTTALLRVFFGWLPELLGVLGEWFTTISDWFTNTDWTTEATKLITAVQLVVLGYPALLGLGLLTWFNKIRDWFDKTDWEKEADKPITRIDKILRTMPVLLGLTLNTWWTKISTWFSTTDWSSLGASIVDGLVAGISSKLGEAKAAIIAIGSGVESAWNDFWGIQSPSRLMIESGKFIMEGAEKGISSEASNLDTLMRGIGSNMFQNFNNSVSDVLPNAPATNNNISNSNQTTTNNFNVENSFAGQPQVTDADGLRLALAGL